MHLRKNSAAAFTLIELLVVISIIGILVGLLLPAVQMIRESAHGIDCTNRLRQLVLASHHCNDTYGRLPPGLGWFPDTTGSSGGYGNILFHLLPYIEQDNLYHNSAYGPFYFAGVNNVQSFPLRLYCCPSDPSIQSGVLNDLSGTPWGAASFAANAQVFCLVDATGILLNPQGNARIPASIPDGTSNTILFSEKFAQCTNSNYPQGGDLWAYWITGANVAPCHPGFAVSWTGYSIGPGSKFQTRPTPYQGNCDPTLASTPHPFGIHAGMADGSVRSLSTAISPYTWWYLCTPFGGETIPPDGE